VEFRCFGTISTESSPLATSFAAEFSGEIEAGLQPRPESCQDAAVGTPSRGNGISGEPLPAAIASAGPAVVNARVHHSEGSGRNGPGPRGPVSPSFVIRGSSSTLASGASPYGGATPLRLDRINSAEVLGLARGVYFAYLSACSAGAEPLGVVLAEAGGGRVVFELPVLLPRDQFVPIEWLRSRSQGRGRGSRGSAPGRTPA